MTFFKVFKVFLLSNRAAETFNFVVSYFTETVKYCNGYRPSYTTHETAKIFIKKVSEKIGA